MTLIGKCVHYYKLDTNNVTQPDSVGSLDGTVSSATYTASGKINGGYVFTATQLIRIKTDATGWFNTTQSHCVSGWYNFTGSTTRQFCYDDRGNDGIIRMGIKLNNTTDTIQASVYTGSTIVLDSGVSASGFHHLVLNIDDGVTAKFYVDGVLKVSTAIGSMVGIGTTTNLSLNSLSTNILGMIGTQDEIGIFDETLTDGGVSVGNSATGEVGDLYNSGSGNQYPFSAVTVKYNSIFHGCSF